MRPGELSARCRNISTGYMYMCPPPELQKNISDLKRHCFCCTTSVNPIQCSTSGKAYLWVILPSLGVRENVNFAVLQQLNMRRGFGIWLHRLLLVLMEYYPTTYRPDHLFDISRIRTVLLTFYAVSERLSGTSIFEYAYIAKDPGNIFFTANMVTGSHQASFSQRRLIQDNQHTPGPHISLAAP